MTGTTVEFFGLPGAGKTSLRDAVQAELRSRGVESQIAMDGFGSSTSAAVRYGRKLAVTAGALITAPKTTVGLIAAMARSRQPTLAVSMRRSLTWLSTEAAMAEAMSHPGIHLMDEGMLQCLWSVALTGDVRPVLYQMRAAEQFFSPGIVVAVCAPIAVLLDRIERRAGNHGRLDRADQEGRHQMLIRGGPIARSLLDWYSNSHGAGGVIEVMNPDGAPLEEVATTVSDQLLQELGRLQRPPVRHS